MSQSTRVSIALAALVLQACRAQDNAPAALTAPSSAPTAPSAMPAAVPAATSGAASSTPPASPRSARTWSFDDDRPDSPPQAFAFGRTGEGREGKWIVRPDPTAPSGSQLLAQVDADKTDDRYPVAFASEAALKDLDLKVRCKAISGGVDQACGLVFRLKDPRNYYVTRANALENNVRLYFVKDGRRQQVASWSGKVATNTWHEYRVVARGDHIEVFWNAAKVLDHHDATFPEAGKVGVWTKADSVTYFDDLRVEPL